ncbi:MAG: helix-turn-helix domain-containing protein [Parcubacteria group bacterium]|jgi:sugar-specific transcriptional regulator TrmB
MDQDLIKIIESVGLRDKEAKVYLALLELGKGTATEVAKNAGLKRSIVYVILEDLMKRGLASQLPDKKINEYQPIDPSAILVQQKAGLKNFAEMLPLLQTLRYKGGKKPKIQYVENKNAILNIYEELNYAEWAYYISSYQKIDELISKKVLEQWIKNYAKGLYKVEAKHLIPDNPTELKYGQAYKEAGQNIKILSGINEFNMDLTLTENKFVITFIEESPFLVLIESETLSRSLKPLFEIIWRSAKEL